MNGKITKITSGKNRKDSEIFQNDSDTIIQNSESINFNSAQATLYENYKNPCDCNDVEKNKLQREVENNCKGGAIKKCTEVDNCPNLIEKENQFRQCMKARIKINSICFRGGDVGHNEQVQNQIMGIIKCQTISLRKCSSKDKVPEPQNIPEVDDDFMKKMEKLTGLSGAALIIYLIFSEGSRLFPPRNLVPIP